jgi:hypothetical protein
VSLRNPIPNITRCISRPVTIPLHSLAELDALTPANIEDVADVVDPLVRNELITHNYWRIANRFYDRYGTANLVWPTFGSWASTQAGQQMRLGVAAPIRLVTAGASTRVTELLGQGNQLIFRDIAPPFDRFLNFLDATPEPDVLALIASPTLTDDLAVLLSLNPQDFEASPTGEWLMVLAFEQYLRALYETDDDARAERFFVANACVGLQEQTRVDSSLDALLDLKDLNRELKPWMKLLRPVLQVGTNVVDWAWPTVSVVFGDEGPALERRLTNFKRLLSAIVLDGRVTQVVGTQVFFELDLGENHFDLGDDLRDGPFARGLETISLTAADFQRSFDLVAVWDRTPDSTHATAAADWSDLSDRMNFILDLFRSYQADERLTTHPLAGL